ncbi:MAG: MBOAT family O-acyltransferase [Eubacteriales bacterium]|nr:MBOAT family O-acyltransferase [Eubacteriales bacterium]
MTVNTVPFFVCFAISVLIYYAVPKRFRWMVLLGVSLLFYHLMGVDNFIYVIITTVTLVVSTGRMQRIDDRLSRELKETDGLTREEKKQRKARAKTLKRRWLVLGVLFVNLGILLVLKYGDFFIFNFNRIFQLLGLNTVNQLGFMAPLGMSYYTLQSIGYALEVYKGKVKAERNPFKVLLFVTYYPQMTQGPIGRYPDLAPQLFRGHEFSYHNLSYGCQRILWGLFKKVIIADRMKPLVTTIFDGYADASGFTLFMGCVYMALQIYADFSGYTDIVLGMSQIYGIRMSENFERPYFANSLSEFWRRWHMSLSSWFRDYVFYPVSISHAASKLGKWGKKVFGSYMGKMFPVLLALATVWFCTGFWHDASWRYIFWGLGNGGIIALSFILQPQFDKMKNAVHIRDDAWWWRGFTILRTFFIVAILKVFPGAASTQQSLGIIRQMLFHFQPAFSMDTLFPGMETYELLYIAFGLLVLFCVSLLQIKMPVRDRLAKLPFVVRWCVYFLLLAFILGLGAFDSDMVGGFEYAQF